MKRLLELLKYMTEDYDLYIDRWNYVDIDRSSRYPRIGPRVNPKRLPPNTTRVDDEKTA